MKRITPIALFLISISTTALAQDEQPAPAVGYIPGMPVPQATTATPAPAKSASQNSGLNATEGAITKVGYAGQGNSANQAAAPSASSDAATTSYNDAEYKGVTPPTRLVPENSQTFAKTSANQLSWIGFMPSSDKHRVFLQTTTPTTYERVATSDDRVELLLANTTLAVTNNTRELDMSYFNSPFVKARAQKAASGVKVVIQLKGTPSVEIVQQDNIINVFAAPQSEPAGSASPAAPAESAPAGAAQ